MERRLKLPFSIENDPNATLAYGRALLANGRAQEAIEPLRIAYSSWLGSPAHRKVCLPPKLNIGLGGLPCGRRRARALDGGRGQAHVGDLQAEIAPKRWHAAHEPCLAIADDCRLAPLEWLLATALELEGVERTAWLEALRQ